MEQGHARSGRRRLRRRPRDPAGLLGAFTRTAPTCRPFFHATLGFDATDEQLERIHTRLEQRELERSEWIKRHGTAGRSLATAGIEQAMRESKADGGDPNQRLAHLVRAVAEEEFGASGGASIPVGDAGTDA